MADYHKESVLKPKSLHAPTVVKQLSSEAAKMRAETRMMLLKVLSSHRFCFDKELLLEDTRKLTVT